MSSDPRKSSSRFHTLAGSARERARTWRRKGATAAFALLALFMGYHVMFGHNGLTAFHAKRAEAQQLDQELLQLQSENARLQGHVDRLENGDPGAIEHEAREDLHYTKADEVIVTLPVTDPSKPPAPTKQN